MKEKKKDLFLVSLLVICLIALAFVFKSPDQCEAYTQFTWLVNITQKSIKRLGEADHSVTLCDIPPYTGYETAQIQISSTDNTVVYSENIVMDFIRHYDYVDADGKLKGGTIPETETVITTYLPQTKLTNVPMTLTVLKLQDKTVVARGDL